MFTEPTHFSPTGQEQQTGVYRITCHRGKNYVGSTTRDFKWRWNLHLRDLRAGNHHSRHLQAAWNLFGESAFCFIVIERCQPEKCIEREQCWIDELKAAKGKYGYNCSPTAGSNAGIKKSPETCARMSAGKKGKKRTPEQRAGMVIAQRLRFQTQTVTEETRARLREAQLKRDPSTQATFAVRSVGQKGRVFTEEHKERLRLARVGRKLSAEHKARIGFASRGSKNKSAVLTESVVLEIRRRYDAGGESYVTLAIAFGVSKFSVGRVVRREAWTHI